MALLRRRAAAVPTGPRAVYARILDGEHLWLAVAGAGSVRLGDHEVATEPDGDRRTACLPLAPCFTGPGDLPLTADGAPLAADGGILDEGPMRTPPSADGRRQYTVLGPTALRVTCAEIPAEVLLLDAWVDDGELVVRLDADGTLSVGEATVPVTGGLARIAAEHAPAATTPLSLGGRPVRRPRNALGFPGAAVVLPGLDGGDDFSPYLRWLRDGTLALARADDS